MASEIPCKRWQITLENYSPYDIKKLQDYCKVNCDYAVLVKGVSAETETPCLQALLIISLKRRESTLKRALFGNALYEPIRAKLLMQYLDPLAENKFWDHGSLQKQKPASSPKKFVSRAGKGKMRNRRPGKDMMPYQQPYHPAYLPSIVEDTKPEFRPHFYAIWIYGPTGVGKSHFAHETFPEAYVKLPDNQYWDGYRSERSVIIDDVNTHHEDSGHWQVWLDRYPCRVDTKNSSCSLLADEFILTSTFDPSLVFKKRTDSMLRRMTVFKVTERSQFDAVRDFVSLQRQLREHQERAARNDTTTAED